MSYPLFKPTYRVDECLKEIRECLESGWTGAGFKTDQFEEAWKQFTGFPHAHFLASATAGLHLAIHILKSACSWNDQDEVITTPFTFVSTNHVLLHCRLKPVFADIDASLCLDPASIEERITPRTRAVLFVGIGGNCGQYRQVRALCQRHGLKLILDAAHMSGTYIDGQHAGLDADAAVFSFHAVKNLPTADGGMLCLPQKELDERARSLAWLGIDSSTYARTSRGGYRWGYNVQEAGFKYHGNSIMASLALVGLRYLQADNHQRRQIAAWYREALKDIAGLRMIPVPEHCISSTHLFQIRVPQRDRVLAELTARGISAGMHYQVNTSFTMYAEAQGSCPEAERASREVISLPMVVSMQESDTRAIATALREILAALPARAKSE